MIIGREKARIDYVALLAHDSKLRFSSLLYSLSEGGKTIVSEMSVGWITVG